MSPIIKDIFLWSSDNREAICTFLTGFAFSRDALIVGNEGMQLFLQRPQVVDFDRTSFIEGRFSITIRDGDDISISADPLGQEVIYYYADAEFWAVSNSFLALCRKVEEIKGELTPYRAATAIFFVEKQGLFGGQLISNNTVVKGVKVLPLRHYIKISSYGLQILAEQPIRLHGYDEDAYLDEVKNFIRNTCVRMISLASINPGRTFVDISGGQDSRAVFGLVVTSPRLREMVTARSNPRMEEDYEIAKELCAHYNFHLGPAPVTGIRLSGYDAFEAWALGNAGVYAPIYKPRSLCPANLMQFAGGNFLARSYLSKTLEVRLTEWGQFLTKRDLDALKDELITSLAPFADTKDGKALLGLHYKHYRARFHYGKAWYSNLLFTNYTPLLSTDFERVVEVGTNSGLSKSEIMRDIMVASDDTLARFRFDKGNTPYSDEEVLGSPCRGLNVAKLQTDELSIFTGPFRNIGSNSTAGPSFEELLAERFHALKASIVAAELCSAEFVKKAEAELATNPLSPKASVIVGLGLVFNL